MRNGPVNVLIQSRGPGATFSPWPTDDRPSGRLAWLFLAMIVPLIAVIVRLVQLQCYLVDDYVAWFSATTESDEPIPSVDGRIYASDGRVLAEDLERYNVSVHYRWLEDPPDERWLTRLALSSLSRSQRRNRALVDAEKCRVRESREEMWRRVSELTGTPAARLRAQRQAISQRVRRIAALVAQRQGSDTRQPTADDEQSANDGSPLARIWQVVKAALTTPPQRGEPEPTIMQEELDYHVVVDDVPLEVRAQIEAHPRWFPGVRVGCTTRRVYYESDSAPHVVGVRVPATAEDLARRKSQIGAIDPLDYQPGDRLGRTGVEASYDFQLHGLRGLRKLIRNRYGEIVREEIVRAPHRGADLELTLNSAVQRKMEQLLDALLVSRPTQGPNDGSDTPTGGCVVALDIQTGAVLVAASAPRFDLGRSGVPVQQAWKRFVRDARSPLLNRATAVALPPGSIFKIVAAAALLDGRQIDPEERYECRGYLEKPDRLRCLIYTQHGVGHGPVDLAQALSQSCNVYFFHAAAIIGPQALADWAQRFGFGRLTGVDLPFERTGHVPDPGPASNAADPKITKKVTWQVADTRALAIGQSSLTVTPLQIARMMAAIANGGDLVTPFVARESGPQNAEQAGSGGSRRERIVGLSDQVLARIRHALEMAVSDPSGTAYRTVRSDQIAIAGKTGTAQVGAGEPDHAWFAGYAPADRPRVAFAVVLEHAGSGGKAAGPVARQLVEAFIADGTLEPARITMRP